ncbi:MAG TPA: YihY/virulence factor BrkB family protein, partial [Bdellovibrio sp.]|uniref:YihY/virulence factor BrkB family protein n=1 Tax=Bdellovibrio sp. TaxID=28201 RepID=UPI002F193D68
KIWEKTKKILGKDFLSKLGRDDIFEMSASLAYYTALSLAPLLILMLTFISLIHQEFRNQLLVQIRTLVGSQAGAIIQDIAKNVDDRADLRQWAGLIGFVTLMFSAGAIFGELRTSLNKIFEASDTKEKSDGGVIGSSWSFLKSKLFNMGMVLTFVFISIVSLIVSSVISISLKGTEALVGQTINFLVSVFIFAVLFAGIYYFLPQTKVVGKVAFTSGVITALLFSIGKSLIGAYLGQSAVASLYGAAGSFIVLLMWVYYSAAVIFFSAEIAQQINKDVLGSITTGEQHM